MNAGPAGADAGRDVVVLDPYRHARHYARGQFHAHTTRSVDGKMSPAEVVAAYRGLGFHLVCLTDHDRITGPQHAGGPEGVAAYVDGCLVISGEESTVPMGLPFLGPHLLRLFVRTPVRRWTSLRQKLQATAADGGLAAGAHPTWPGNLGTGQWTLSALEDPGIGLVEIVNHHSPTEANLAVWDELLRRRGPERPVWALAVDDSHRPHQVGRAWVEIGLAAEPARAADGNDAAAFAAAVRQALGQGSFYCTTGLEAFFGFRPENGEIWVRCDPSGSPGGVQVRFVGPGRRLLAQQTLRGSRTPAAAPAAVEATYPVDGTEGFVRVELADLRGRAAWSQPFWTARRLRAQESREERPL